MGAVLLSPSRGVNPILWQRSTGMGRRGRRGAQEGMLCGNDLPASSRWRKSRREDEERGCIGIGDGRFGVCSSRRASPEVRASRPLRTEKKLLMEVWVNSSCVPALRSVQPPRSEPPPAPHSLLNPHSAQRGSVHQCSPMAVLSPQPQAANQSTTHPDKGVKSQKGGGGASLGAAGTPRPNAAPTASPHPQESHRMDFPSSAPSPRMGTHHCRALGTAGERTRKWGCHGNQRTASTDFIYLFIWLFAYFCQDWGGKKRMEEWERRAASLPGWMVDGWGNGGVEGWRDGWRGGWTIGWGMSGGMSKGMER